MNLFPATAAILLRERTWLSDIAIENWLRNYGRGGHSEGHPLWVNTRDGSGAMYKFRYVSGLWRFVKEK